MQAIENKEETGNFICPCCRGRQAEFTGIYRLPSRRNTEGGLVGISYPLMECARCTHVAAHPVPSAVDIGNYYGSKAFWKTQGVKVDESSKGWRQKLIENSSLWERFERGRRQFEFIRRSIPLKAGSRVIDLGSGYSPLLYFFAEAGFRNLYALEPFEEICAFLNQQGVTTYPTLLEDFVMRGDLPTFDLMVISHTLEHLVDPAEVIAGLARHLAPNGVLYIDVPFQDHLRPYKQGLHYQFFNETSMDFLAQQTGLAVRAVEHDRPNLIERQLLRILFGIYGLSFGKKEGITANPRIDLLHKFAWRPFRSLLGLKINIFISSLDLRLILSRQP